MRDRRHIVDKTKQARRQRSQENGHETAGEPTHDKARYHERHEDHHATHGRRALLHEMALGTVGAHLLADTLDFEQTYPKRHEHHRDDG